jgi:hypothetical protein
MTYPHVLGTLGATALLCVAVARGRGFGLLARLGHRTVVSLAGGAAVAYVFMDLLPELHSAAHAFRDATSHLAMRGLEMGIYLATLAGFLFFYGVEDLVILSQDEEARQSRRAEGKPHRLFRVHMAAFSAYAWLVSYLLVHSLEHTTIQLVFYTVAMALHFISVAHALREEHGALYDRIGSPMLVASCAAGWVCGMAFAFPEAVIGVLFGAVAGGIVANTVISELPREKQGRFIPFVLGAAVYAALLIVAG